MLNTPKGAKISNSANLSGHFADSFLFDRTKINATLAERRYSKC